MNYKILMGILVAVFMASCSPSAHETDHHDEHEAAEEAEEVVVSSINTTVISKEQASKIDVTTALPRVEPFGQVIKTTALVQAAQENEAVVVAKTNGVVSFHAGAVLEGVEVKAGQALCTVSSGNFAGNNGAVNFAEASSRYEKARADYERATELATDKIVSQKELLAVKADYEQAKAVYDNLKTHFSASGHTVTSPLSGFIKQVFVKNGSYVEAGQALVEVSSNSTLFLRAEVPTKHASILATIKTATIRSMSDNRTYSLESLNGKVVSYGKAASGDGFLIPITVQISNNGSFIPGSFVEVNLKTVTSEKALVVPVTALMEEQGAFFVWVQLTPERYEKREVFLGGTDGIDVAIKQGIAVNERIVTRGAMLIKLAQSTGALDAHSGHVH